MDHRTFRQWNVLDSSGMIRQYEAGQRDIVQLHIDTLKVCLFSIAPVGVTQVVSVTNSVFTIVQDTKTGVKYVKRSDSYGAPLKIWGIFLWLPIPFKT